MLKNESVESISIKSTDKQEESQLTNSNTNAVNKFKQIALIRFDDSNSQQILPNYL